MNAKSVSGLGKFCGIVSVIAGLSLPMQENLAHKLDETKQIIKRRIGLWELYHDYPNGVAYEAHDKVTGNKVVLYDFKSDRTYFFTQFEEKGLDNQVDSVTIFKMENGKMAEGIHQSYKVKEEWQPMFNEVLEKLSKN